MDQNPYEAPRANFHHRRSRWRRPTIVEIFVLAGVIVVLISLFLPSVRTGPHPHRRMKRFENIPAENYAEQQPEGVRPPTAGEGE